LLLVLADADPDAQHNKESGDVAQLKTGKRKRSAAVKNDVEKNKNDDACKAFYSHWLMKSEPESRIENGVDVKVNLLLLLLKIIVIIKLTPTITIQYYRELQKYIYFPLVNHNYDIQSHNVR